MKKKIILLGIILVILAILSAAVQPYVWKNDCVGCGDCVKVCPVGAISIINGKAVIDNNKCINCKLCVSTCAYDAIRQGIMKKYKLIILVLIILLLIIAACKKATAYSYVIDQNSCIACGKCFEACPHNAIIYQGDKPVIIQSKCVQCGKCVSVCPENAIH